MKNNKTTPRIRHRRESKPHDDEVVLFTAYILQEIEDRVSPECQAEIHNALIAIERGLQ